MRGGRARRSVSAAADIAGGMAREIQLERRWLARQLSGRFICLARAVPVLRFCRYLHVVVIRKHFAPEPDCKECWSSFQPEKV